MNGSDDRDDEDLARRMLTDDRESYAVLIRRHAPHLAAYLGGRIRRVDVVDELVQQAIETAWSYRHKLKDPAGFIQWFRRLGANLAMRWRKAHPNETLSAPFPVDRCADLAEAAWMNRVEEALGDLDERTRLALEYRYRGGLEGANLAEALHVGDERAAADHLDRALIAFDHALQARR